MAQDRGADAGEDLFDLSSLGDLGNVGRDFDPLLEVRNLLVEAKVSPMDRKRTNSTRLTESQSNRQDGPCEPRARASS